MDATERIVERWEGGGNHGSFWATHSIAGKAMAGFPRKKFFLKAISAP